VPDVYNIMILQDWDPEEDEWKGIDFRNIEFADTQAWAANPNCNDTLNTWGPVCKPCKHVSESSLPNLEPITPPHSSHLLLGDCANRPIFVEDSLPAPCSLSLPPCNPTTKAWVKAIHAQRRALTPLQDVAPPFAKWSRSPRWSPCSHVGTAAR
jgi:hypothetical protein